MIMNASQDTISEEEDEAGEMAATHPVTETC